MTTTEDRRESYEHFTPINNGSTTITNSSSIQRREPAPNSCGSESDHHQKLFSGTRKRKRASPKLQQNRNGGCDNDSQTPNNFVKTITTTTPQLVTLADTQYRTAKRTRAEQAPPPMHQNKMPTSHQSGKGTARRVQRCKHIYSGLTTEEQVKAAPFALAQTTLQKLASFKCDLGELQPSVQSLHHPYASTEMTKHDNLTIKRSSCPSTLEMSNSDNASFIQAVDIREAMTNASTHGLLRIVPRGFPPNTYIKPCADAEFQPTIEAQTMSSGSTNYGDMELLDAICSTPVTREEGLRHISCKLLLELEDELHTKYATKWAAHNPNMLDDKENGSVQETIDRSQPAQVPFQEARRSSSRLQEMGVDNQLSTSQNTVPGETFSLPKPLISSDSFNSVYSQHEIDGDKFDAVLERAPDIKDNGATTHELTFQHSLPRGEIIGQSSTMEDVENDFPMDEQGEAEMAVLDTEDALEETERPLSEDLRKHISEVSSRDMEIYDVTLQYFDPLLDESLDIIDAASDLHHNSGARLLQVVSDEDAANLGFLAPQLHKALGVAPAGGQRHDPLLQTASFQVSTPPGSTTSQQRVSSIATTPQVITTHDDTYSPIPPFARSEFPRLVSKRPPVSGLSSKMVLRTCFRIGEALRAGTFCDAHRQDAVIELFARLTFSSREQGTTKQHFQFADLFHDRPPFPNGILTNYKASTRQEAVCGELLRNLKVRNLVRCLGRLKRDTKGTGWLMQITNIRTTDWEEIRYTKGIVGAEVMQAEDLHTSRQV